MDMVTAMGIIMDYRSIASVGLISVVGLTGGAMANTLKLKPSVDVTHIYSDNLQVDNQDSSDQITQLSPSLHLTNQGSVIESNLSYQYTRLKYQKNTELDKGYDTYNGAVLFKLFDNRLRSRFTANKRRQQTSLLQPQSLLADNSQSDVVDYNAFNQYRSSIDDYVDYQINWNLNKVKATTDDDQSSSLVDSDAQRINLSMRSGRYFNSSYWSLNANRTRINYDRMLEDNSQQKQIFSTYSAELGHEIYRDLSFFGRFYDEEYDLNNQQSSNLESSSYGAGFKWQPSRYSYLKVAYNWAIDDNSNDDHVSAEFNWQPSPRTNLQLTAGKRFFGDAYSASFSHRMRRVNTLISYSENITNFQSSSLVATQVGHFICPATQDYDISDCTFAAGEAPSIGSGQQLIPVNGLIPELNNTTYLDKRYLANISYQKRKINLSLSYNNSKRQALDSLVETHRQAISLSMGYAMNRQANFNFSANYNEYDGQANRVSGDRYRQQQYSVSYSHKLSRLLSISARVFHRTRDSRNASSDFDENRIVLSLQQGF